MSDAVSVEEPQSEVAENAATGDVVIYSSAGVRRVAPASLVQEYNFRQPGFLSPRDANQYNSHHQKYAQNLAARLATFLRVELTCEASSVRCETLPFRSFCDAVAQPTHLSVFQFEGLEGAGALEVRPKTSIALANRLLGGQGVLAGEGTLRRVLMGAAAVRHAEAGAEAAARPARGASDAALEALTRAQVASLLKA